MINKEELKEKADKMTTYLQLKSGSEPNELIERIEMLSILISRSGECLAAAKYYQDTIISSAIMGAIKDGYSDKLGISVLNKFVASLAKEENFLVNQFDRINSSGAKQLAGLITVLSYRKTEFSTLSYSK